MSFLSALFGVETRKKQKSVQNTGPFGLGYYSGSSYNNDQAMKLSAVFCAVEMISRGVASLPLAPYHVNKQGFLIKATEHNLCHIIECEPNCRMTRQTLIELLIRSALLRGAGYAYVERGISGEPIALHFVPFEWVTINPPRYLNEPVTYAVVGINGIVKASDLITILNYTSDGVTGQSTLSFAREALGLAHDENNYARGFFQRGAAVGGILMTDTRLNDQQRKELKESWVKAHSGEQQNSVAVLEGGMRFEKISVDPNDSELLASRQFSIPEIARFFCISPTKLFDYSHSSYNTLEATNLSFLTDTLAPWISKIEAEFERKLFPVNEHSGISVKFDTSKLLKADKTAQANYYSKLYSIGAVSPNDVRRELEMSPIENGDTYFIPCNVMSLDKAINNTPTSDFVTNPAKEGPAKEEEDEVKE